MAKQARKTVHERFTLVDHFFKFIATGVFNDRRNQMSGADVSIDVCFTLWHECRRGKEQVASFGNVTELNVHAQGQYTDPTYDLAANVAEVVVLLNALQGEIGTTILDLSPQGIVRTPYARCTDNPPFFNPVKQVKYAQTAILLGQLRDSVTIEV